MGNESKNKLILAVLQGEDYDDTVYELNRNGFFATLLSSTGGFLKKRSVTLMIGVSADKADQVLAILKKRAGKLSGGWMRRLSIAMALVGSPKILFLDEPSLGLDVLARSELWAAIRSLKGSVTIILTTHYMEEAEELSDRIGIMKSGRLLALGSPAELKEASGCPTLEKAFLSYVKEAV